MEFSRTAFVVAHPAHLLTVLGLVQRHRPHVLFLTYASTGAGSQQTNLLRRLLELSGLANDVTCLPIDERESYTRALAGDFEFQLALIPQIEQWLLEIQPEQIFGDAYELTNYHHDIGRLMLDAAVSNYRARGFEVANFEFPLSSQADFPGAELEYGKFVVGPYQAYLLTAEELRAKERWGDWVAAQDPFVADVARRFSQPEVEAFRLVTADRDYTQPSCGLARWYDECGRQEVAAGRYARSILFQEHFVPVARAVRRLLTAAA